MKPDVLWFDVPEWLGDDLSDRGDFWLMALLPLAFRLGEPLELGARIDPVLFQNAEEIMHIWSRWYHPIKPVPIQADLSSGSGGGGAGNTALFFSGGVDSFFSLLHFDEVVRSKATGGRPIDDLIFVWGFDIPIDNREAFERKRNTLSEVANLFGKRLITVVTNLRETSLGSLDWGMVTHGPALGAAGLLLERRFSKILISSSRNYAHLEPWGSHALVDPLMSTSQTRFAHYGAGFDRFEKTTLVARSAAALRYLHVCWSAASDRNCGKCRKCQELLLALELLGARERATSFPPGCFSLEHFHSIPPLRPTDVRRLQRLKEVAVRLVRPDVAREIDVWLANSRQANAVAARFDVFRRIEQKVRAIRKQIPFLGN